MSNIVIRAEGLGKRYILGQASQHESYSAFRDIIGLSLKGWGRSALDIVRGRPMISGDKIEEFWALKDVSFEIKQGEVVGIMGRNGAGKSTLLKILSRITEPSTGRVRIRGRVASLLEVGTGFHPELTGRENIYLNATILGMSRAEIRKRFDEIVDFANVEKFLDTPVKRYSSGMYVRLAFAVAAHLEPEILIIDEVLAVGDAEFQNKCLGKMQQVSKTGRTVLFVSHNLNAMRNLCSAGMLFTNGGLTQVGTVAEVIASYETLFLRKHTGFAISSETTGPLSNVVKFVDVRITQNGNENVVLRPADELEIEIHGETLREFEQFELDINIFRNGILLFTCYDSSSPKVLTKGNFCSIFKFPKHVFCPGTYLLSVGASSGRDGWVQRKDAAVLEFSEAIADSNHLPNRGLIRVSYTGQRLP